MQNIIEKRKLIIK